MKISLIGSLVLTAVSCGFASASEIEEQSALKQLSAYFAKANMVANPSIVDCTLSGGNKTKCFQITVKPEPMTHTPGPWCPENISSSADSGGIWLEEGKVYDVNGAFIENLSTFYSDEKWRLFDSETGAVRITDTYEKCAGAAKPNVEPEYQQHCVECQPSFVEQSKTITYTIPLFPTEADQPSNTRESGSGIAFDGVRLDASAPVSDILSNYTLAPFDDCGGHVNLAVGYHYHAATDCLQKAATSFDHGEAVGLAMDGHLILARQLSDGSTPTDLDQCGGHQTEQLPYHYHAGEQGSNAILGCLVAEYGCVSTEPGAECDSSKSSKKGSRRGPPDFATAAKRLGVREDELKKALGTPPPDFKEAASRLGITVELLQQALGN